MSETSVLLIGLEPSLIDFSDVAYSSYPGLSAENVRAGAAWASPSGKISFIEVMPLRSLNKSVSSESVARARIPAPHRSPFPQETHRIDDETANDPDDHHGSVDAEAIRDGLHGFGVGDSCDDGLGAAHRLQRLGRIIRLAVDVVACAQ